MKKATIKISGFPVAGVDGIYEAYGTVVVSYAEAESLQREGLAEIIEVFEMKSDEIPVTVEVVEEKQEQGGFLDTLKSVLTGE